MEVIRELPATNGRELVVKIDSEHVSVEISEHPDHDRVVNVDRNGRQWRFAVTDEEHAEAINANHDVPEWTEALLLEIGIREVAV